MGSKGGGGWVVDVTSVFALNSDLDSVWLLKGLLLVVFLFGVSCSLLSPCSYDLRRLVRASSTSIIRR